MTEFNNKAYSLLVEDLLNDSFYVEAGTPRGKIAKIRQYTEVIVRKFLDLSDKENVTLGNGKILSEIKKQSDSNPLLINSLKKINSIGSKCTHTQTLRQITEEDLESCIQNLFNLYAYLFVSYFNKYRFGINNNILSSFSILPPIIRYIALKNLFEEDVENVAIIDRLSLAMVKAFDENRAKSWLDDQKEVLSNMSSYTPEAALDLKEQAGEAIAQMFISQAPNMYDCCVEKVMTISQEIQRDGPLYYDFEGALPYYKDHGIVEGESVEVSEFNDLMEFVYLGRKPKIKERQ